MKTKIKQARKQAGIKGKDLAEALGVTPAYISLVENGKTAISAELVEKIAEITKLPLNFFYDEDTKKAPQNETQIDNLKNEIKEIKENLKTIEKLLLKILAK